MRCAIALVLSLILPITATVAATGEPDTSFGAGGLALIAFDIDGPQYDPGLALLIQDDGRLVVGGVARTGATGETNEDFAAARLMPDGSLDSSFGNGGRRTVAFDLGGFSDYLSAMAAYPGDRILLAGTAYDVDGIGSAGAWAIARLTGNGTLDTSFDLDGRRHFTVVPTTQDSGSLLTDLAVQPDGKILLCGYSFESGVVEIVVARLDPDGSFDTGFADGGIGRFDPVAGDPAIALPSAIALRPDGRIVIGGSVNTDTSEGVLNYDMFVQQLNADGTIDTTFANGGVQTIAFDQGGSNLDSLTDLVIDAGGRLIAGGVAATASSGNDMAAARLLPDGTPDPAFGSSGRVLVGFDLGGDLDDRANALAVDASNRIVLAGKADAAGSLDIAILRLTEAGLPDAEFATAGKFVLAIDNDPPEFDDESAEAVALDDRGRVVAAGWTYLGPDSNYDMMVLRLTGELLFRDRFEASP